jgi:hypothetical protein
VKLFDGNSTGYEAVVCNVLRSLYDGNYSFAQSTFVVL